MKKSFLLLAAGLAAVAPLAAQLAITSLSQNGQLTWTNSVSNANYRVEWANSVTGAWQGLEALTNLSSIAATSTTVTVQVPMFYRVVWTDAPNPLGDWDYRGYDLNGVLVVTGRISIVTETNYAPSLVSVAGNWTFGYAGPPTNNLAISALNSAHKSSQGALGLQAA